MFEHRTHPVLSRPLFFRRVGRALLLAFAVIGAALAIGVLGYHLLGGLGWLDAVLNASMILAGMGPVDRVDSAAAKVFASLYALLSGLVFIGTAGVLAAPWLHRLLHMIHADAVAAGGVVGV
ncbi:MAG: hypothetical protein IRY94_17040 [Rhodospirillaceae bacterium]|nr:hypothetical protein [Rhodospirillaceae bacterium]